MRHAWFGKLISREMYSFSPLEEFENVSYQLIPINLSQTDIHHVRQGDWLRAKSDDPAYVMPSEFFENRCALQGK